MTKYDKNFYERRHKLTLHSAREILSIARDIIPRHESIVDLGCGVGTWLFVARELGFVRIKGFEGEWVDKKFLEIPEECFQAADLEKKIELDTRFDLAMTLEVAEHISEKSAETFVDSLVGLSDFVLFSAAIPWQGGKNHVNERWPEYWVEKFAARGYEVVDVIRPQIWNDPEVRTWYRQNTMMFVKSERRGELRNVAGLPSFAGLSMAHPKLFESKMEKRSGKGFVRYALRRLTGGGKAAKK